MTHSTPSSSAHSPGLSVAALATAMVLGSLTLGLESRPQAASMVPSGERATVHTLNRMGFGPTPALLARVSAMGLERYIDEQLHPERIADPRMSSRLAHLTTVDASSRELADRYFIPALRERLARQRASGSANAGADGNVPSDDPTRAMNDGAGRPNPGGTGSGRSAAIVLEELAEQRILRAVYSDKQLQEVLVDFWFNHFNVFAGKGAVRQFVTEYERDTIRPHVLGRFRDLLGATAKSPAMLFYLDNWMSTDPDISPETAAQLARTRRQDARAMRRGVEAGRRRTPAPNPSAPPRDVPTGLNENYARELLELHTLGVDGGYTQQDVVEVARAFTGWTLAEPRRGGLFTFDPLMHDAGTKVVLGQTIDSGGVRDGEAVLDLLARHPSTARFIATKLVRRLVADDPPAQLVARAAARFRATDGDLREVVRTIVTSPEFYAPEAVGAKVKTPFEFVVSALRAADADITHARGVVRALRQLGMPLYFAQPPTGYKETADAWVNTGALVGRMNVALALVGNQERGVRIDAARLTPESASLRDLSATTRRTLDDASEPVTMAALLLGSPEFQRR